MKFIEARDLCYQYKTYLGDSAEAIKQTAVEDVSLSVKKGDFVGILGKNGSGKSTLAMQLSALLFPSSGNVWICGMDTAKEENWLPIRKRMGMIFQNPDNQIIGNLVEEDVAFGPENLGIPPAEMEERITAALRATGMEACRNRSPHTLSGGQKQKLAISGVLAMEPDCIVMDEPTAMLDPEGRREVRQAVRFLHEERGITVLYITHHMEEIADADYLYVMDAGRIAFSGTPDAVWGQRAMLRHCGIALPWEARLADAMERAAGEKAPGEPEELEAGKAPGTPEESAAGEISGTPEKFKRRETFSDEGIRLADVCYAYRDAAGGEQKYALDHVSLQIAPGEFLAVVGRTGSGKSTLAQHLNGLLRPTAGQVTFAGKNVWEKSFPIRLLRQKVALCFQYPEYQLFEETVLKDVCFGPKNMGFSGEECLRRAKDALRLLGLPEAVWESAPFALSGGQKRRAALAGVLAMEPEYLVLDEPAAGLDEEGKQALFALLHRLNRERGTAVILVSHDMDDVAEHARRVVVMDRGQVAFSGKTRDIFGQGERLRTLGLALPQAVRYAGERGIRLPDGGVPLTAEELAACLVREDGGRK